VRDGATPVAPVPKFELLTSIFIFTSGTCSVPTPPFESLLEAAELASGEPHPLGPQRTFAGGTAPPFGAGLPVDALPASLVLLVPVPRVALTFLLPATSSSIRITINNEKQDPLKN
jgi:hypothetical protein